MANDRLRVTIYDGKYTIVQRQDGGLHALRYGEPWRDCTGDGMILALAQEVEELREANADMLAALNSVPVKPVPSVSCDFYTQFFAWYEGARSAAIAKATGDK